MDDGVHRFVSASGRPCTAEEVGRACSLPLIDCQRVLELLVLSNRLTKEELPLGDVAGRSITLYCGPPQAAGGTIITTTDVAAVAEREAAELAALQRRVQELDAQIAQHSTNSSTHDKEIGAHMERVHDYNELKDVAQALMGRLATIEGLLTRDLYKRYDLDLED